jgi:predicted RNase H-like HicB family nuclease
MTTYRVMVEKGEDSGYVVHCPAIPGCHSQGKTVEEALENIRDAIRGCLAVKDVELTVFAKKVAAMEVEV